MISQFYGGEAAGVYGGGPPPPVPGVRVIGLEATGEQNGGDFEGDIRQMVELVAREHENGPFDILHAQYAYPTGLAALAASQKLGIPNLVSIQGGDGHWVGSCCETHRRGMLAVLDHAGALLIGSRSFANEVVERLGTPPERFTIIPGRGRHRTFPSARRLGSRRAHRPAPPPAALPRPRGPAQGSAGPAGGVRHCEILPPDYWYPASAPMWTRPASASESWDWRAGSR